MMTLPTLVLVVVFGLVQGAGSVSPSQPRSGTCEIRGRITDKETGLPIARAIIRITRDGSNDRFVERTDDQGHYRFTGLPPGSYGGLVDAGAFRASHVMESLWRPGQLALKEGEIRADVNVTLVRARAMTVRVVDEAGEPLAGVAMSVKSEDGRWNVNYSPFRTTDDRGRLRLFRIPPGRYIVCAEPQRLGGSSHVGSRDRERLLRTCYPSAASETQSTPVQLERSDIEDLEIRVRRGRTFTISGTVIDASGGPATGANVSFTRFDRHGSSSALISSVTDGRFTVSDVPPGEYAIEASLGGPHRPEHRRELEVAFQPVRIDASDVEGVVVALAKGVDVAGRVVLEDPTVSLPRPPGHAPLYIAARLAGARPGGGSRATRAGDDRHFLLDGLFGRRILEVANVPRGWYVKSIRYDGKEIIDVPTEFKASRDPSALEVVLSTRGAVISGRVADERGEPARGARVVLLPADQARWSTHELTNVAVSPTGTFRLGPQRGGDYVIVAVGSSTPLPAPDPERLTHLMKAGERITLLSDEERTIDLRVVSSPSTVPRER